MGKILESRFFTAFSDVDWGDKDECTVSEVFSFLKWAFKPEDFEKAEQIIRLREEKWEKEKELIKAQIQERSVDSELELKNINENLRKELQVCRDMCTKLEARVSQLEEANLELFTKGQTAQGNKGTIRNGNDPSGEKERVDKLSFPYPPLERNTQNNDQVVHVPSSARSQLLFEGEAKEGKRKRNLKGDTAFVEDVDSFNDNLLPYSAHKRKQTSNTITRDNLGDDQDQYNEDKIPIGTLMKKVGYETETSTRNMDFFGSTVIPSGLLPGENTVLKRCNKSNSGPKRICSHHLAGQEAKTENASVSNSGTSDQMMRNEVEQNNVIDIESDSNSGSLRGKEYTYLESDSEVESDSTPKIWRNRESTTWKYKANMLSSFSNDLELCMKGVCALYRQQMSKDKSAAKSSVYTVKCGFDPIDALKASNLAKFLTCGDLHKPLMKSIKELEEWDPNALDYCRRLAFSYLDQLFEIYHKREDPFFCP